MFSRDSVHVEGEAVESVVVMVPEQYGDNNFKNCGWDGFFRWNCMPCKRK